MAGQIVQIWTLTPLDRALDYLVGEENLSIGDVVEVPFGKREIIGVVWGGAIIAKM